MRDGHRNDCKACNLAAKAARHRANPEPARARARKWAAENRERVLEQKEAYRQSGRKAEVGRKYHLKKNYGLSVERYDEMLDAQGGVCAICGAPPRDDISLHVDHDHATGAIRGLTCFRCNNALGDLGDDADRLLRAIEYLTSGVDSLNEAPALEALAKARARALTNAA